MAKPLQNTYPVLSVNLRRLSGAPALALAALAQRIFSACRGPSRHWLALPATICIASLTGCASVGPTFIQGTRTDYNIIIQQTNEQELLLNLVRLKYRDTLYFLTVEKVASSVEFLREVGTSASVPVGGNSTFTLGPARLSINEKPTIFYSPLDGERFTRQMLAVLHPDVLVLLANSGWSLERLMALSIQEMNGLKNAPSAAGPTPSFEPAFKDFRTALKLLRSLQVQRRVEVGQIRDTGRSHLELRFLPDAAADPDALEFKRMLGIDPHVNEVKVLVGLGHGGPESINVVPRSLVAIMNYLSQGVEVPARDVTQGRTTRTVAADGSAFDWQTVLAGLFKVSSADSAPTGAAVAVRYRDAWFFIDDRDLETKSTFSLLSQLMALQAGSTKREETPISFTIGR